MLLKTFLFVYRTFHPTLKASTFSDYKTEVNKFCRWARRDVLVDDFSDQFLAEYLQFSLQRGSPAATVKKSRTTLLALWRCAWQREYCQRQPRYIPPIPLPKHLPSAWTPSQSADLLEACKRAKHLPDWDGRHWVALVLVIYDTGLRLGALLKARKSDLDLPSRWLRTRAENQKQNSEQLHRLSPETATALAAIMDSPGEYVFPWPYHKNRIWFHFKAILRSAGLPATRKDSFHRIRKTNYTLTYAKLGLEAATRNAGHSGDLSRHYLDPRVAAEFSDQKSPADVIPRPSKRGDLHIFDEDVDAG